MKKMKKIIKKRNEIFQHLRTVSRGLRFKLNNQIVEKVDKVKLEVTPVIKGQMLSDVLLLMLLMELKM